LISLANTRYFIRQQAKPGPYDDSNNPKHDMLESYNAVFDPEK
jgi:hypothetical protein